jgi:PHD/YefM family antitoxin component YafN of YafNO toxin-antitoxin module
MGFAMERRDSSTARVPSVRRGRAVVVTRYNRERSVIVNPDDFRRLAELEDALDVIFSDDRMGMTELAAKAQRLEDSPGAPVEDPDRIKKLLDL